MEVTKKKKIGVLTTFYTWSRAYSLTSVVENQLLALVKHGYDTVLFVHDNFDGDDSVPEGVEIRKVIPRFLLVDYMHNQPLSKDFREQVEGTKKALEEHMQDIDVALTHDWIFQGWFLNYNVGMRESNLKCKWLHWVHSAPSLRPANLQSPYDCRYKTMPHSKLIYMNDYDALRLAEMYSGVLDDVRVVYNPLDIRSFYDLHPLVTKLIDKYSLLDADIIDVYPISSTRFDGKKPDKVIKVLAKLKEQGKSVRFICPNAHANAQNEKDAIAKLINYGKEQGLTEREMIFTSLEDAPTYEQGVPREVVRDLFRLSNLFIFPTISENCPLILLEAALSKCLLVLNESFQPLRDFFGKNALYFKFGSLVENVSYDDEERWYHDVAFVILSEINKNKPLNAFTHLMQKFNYDWVFKNQLEPLLYEDF
jgi:glycosyltransferase involved in cell wall biosynthesis